MQFWEGKEPYPREHKGFKILENQEVQMSQKLFGGRKTPFLLQRWKKKWLGQTKNTTKKKNLWKGQYWYPYSSTLREMIHHSLVSRATVDNCPVAPLSSPPFHQSSPSLYPVPWSALTMGEAHEEQ